MNYITRNTLVQAWQRYQPTTSTERHEMKMTHKGLSWPWVRVWLCLWVLHSKSTVINASHRQLYNLPPSPHDSALKSISQEYLTPRLPPLSTRIPRVHSRNPLVRDQFTVKWRMIAEDSSLHPVNFTALRRTRELEDETFLVKVLINKDSVQVFRDHVQVYRKDGSHNKTLDFQHAGIHLVVMHPQHGRVMLARHFLTHQPSEHRNLASCLASLLPGRIVAIAAVPEAVMFLGEDAIIQLELIGASRIRNLAVHEAWAFIFHTPSLLYHDNANKTRSDTINYNSNIKISHNNNKYSNNDKENRKPFNPSHSNTVKGHTWGEAASIIRRPGREANPLTLEARIPKIPGMWCSWHEDPAMEEQRRFCDTYEGYLRLCTCSDPITRNIRYSAPHIKMKEVIPVAMLTAVKPFHFYRQLLNLLETPGAAQTPILVLVDGPREEIMRLAELFGLDALVHRPQGEQGSSTLLNMHFRFSVHNVFNFFPDVDKAIILEDDLLLSPDFIAFFQQTAWLLDADPTIYCVNSFSVNSYPTVASDPHVLRRLEMFPQFGWMINRRWAREQFAYWIPESIHGADWDWWLSSQNSAQGRHALIPEVGRSFHEGSAGAHVTGWLQEHIFSTMIYNQDPDVKLLGLEDLILDRYKAKMKKQILNATDLVLGDNFCSVPFDSILPKNLPGPFRVFVLSPTKSDEYGSFFVMHLCTHAFTMDSREIFEGVVRFNLKGRLLFIIGCPVSPYCRLFPKGVKLIRPTPALLKIAEDWNSQRETRNYPAFFPVRREMGFDPLQEFFMENLFHSHFNGTLVEMKPRHTSLVIE